MKTRIFLCLFQILFLFDLSAQENSVLYTGDWYKITTNKDGIYKLDYSDLNALGVNTSMLQNSSIKIYGNGGGMLPKLNSDFRYSDLTENAIKVYDANQNGLFENGDYILFYGTSPNVWNFSNETNLFEYEIHLFDDEVSYFLTIDNESKKRFISEEY